MMLQSIIQLDVINNCNNTRPPHATPVGVHMGDGSTNATFTRGTMYSFVRSTHSESRIQNLINGTSDLGIPTLWVDWAIGGLRIYIGDPGISIESD
jgi:hypothetical protein